MMWAIDRATAATVSTLIDEGCRCADRRACDLWSACASIHRAFTPVSDLH